LSLKSICAFALSFAAWVQYRFAEVAVLNL